jgi:periplasmic copper chaperone A
MQIYARKIISLLSLLLALGLAGCGSKSNIEIEEAWGRPSPMSSDLGAIYMTIRNNGSEDEKLLSASSNACGSIEMHETVMDGDTMSMRPVAEGFITIPAGESVILKTGGLHLMCIDKQADFSEGATISLTLEFEQFGLAALEIKVQNP